jgi:hypothetical protein
VRESRRGVARALDTPFVFPRESGGCLSLSLFLSHTYLRFFASLFFFWRSGNKQKQPKTKQFATAKINKHSSVLLGSIFKSDSFACCFFRQPGVETTDDH